MENFLTGTSLVLIIVGFVVVAFAAIFMPVFVMIIAMRLKVANATLKRMEALLSAANRHGPAPGPRRAP